MNPILTYENLAGRATSVQLAGGDLGTEQTIAAIRNLVDEALRDPVVRQAAGWIVARVQPYNDQAEVRAVYEWVRQHVRFTKDPIGKETLSSARWILSHGFGDCDDINAVLLPSLLGALGYGTQLVTVSLNPNDPESFSHVYAEVFLRGRWIALDAARPSARFGEAPRHHYRKRVWSLTDASYQDVRGLPAGLNGDFRLGGWVDDWSKIIQNVTSGIANIFASQKTGIPPTQPLYAPAPAGFPESGLSTNTMLLLGGGALLVVVLAMRK